MYDKAELMPMPTEEELGKAFDTLINYAMNSGGDLSGLIERVPLPGAGHTTVRTFHFSFHDTRICEYHTVGSQQFGTLQ